MRTQGTCGSYSSEKARSRSPLGKDANLLNTYNEEGLLIILVSSQSILIETA